MTDVGGQFRGTTIKVVTENTPPGSAIRTLMEEQFIPLTGINVEWEVVPLDQVLSTVSVDAAQQLGQNDIYYLDQAWVGRFINDAFDPRELLQQKPDLAFPNYNLDDFLQPLVDHIASYGGKMIGFPCDVPIFLYMYRTDIYQELGLQPAATLAEYLANARAINEAKSAQGVYGTVGQMKSGHYSLECDMTAYVWGHGGSVFTADGMCSLNDAQAIAGLDYLRELQTYMPGAVTTYDWGGQATAIQQGQGGQVLTWSENFPGWDDPTTSQVSGLMQPAVPPAAVELRPPDQAGFEETPEVGHQGGSAYCSVPLLEAGRRRLDLPPVGDQRRHPDPRLDPRRRGEPHAALDLRRPAGGGDEAGRRRHHPPLRRDAANDRDPDGDRAPFAAVAVDRDRRDRRRARQADHRRLRVDEGRRRRDRRKGQRSGQLASRSDCR